MTPQPPGYAEEVAKVAAELKVTFDVAQYVYAERQRAEAKAIADKEAEKKRREQIQTGVNLGKGLIPLEHLTIARWMVRQIGSVEECIVALQALVVVKPEPEPKKKPAKQVRRKKREPTGKRKPDPEVPLQSPVGSSDSGAVGMAPENSGGEGAGNGASEPVQPV